MAARPLPSSGWRTVVSPAWPAAGTSSKPVTVSPVPAAIPRSASSSSTPSARMSDVHMIAVSSGAGRPAAPGAERALVPGVGRPLGHQHAGRSGHRVGQPGQPQLPHRMRLGAGRQPLRQRAGHGLGRHVLAAADRHHAHPAMPQFEHVPGDRGERRPVVDADEVHARPPRAASRRSPPAAAGTAPRPAAGRRRRPRRPRSRPPRPAAPSRPGRLWPAGTISSDRPRSVQASPRPCRNSTAPGSRKA